MMKVDEGKSRLSLPASKSESKDDVTQRSVPLLGAMIHRLEEHIRQGYEKFAVNAGEKSRD